MKGSQEAIDILRGFVAGHGVLLSAVNFNDKFSELHFHHGSSTGRRVIVKNARRGELLKVGAEYSVTAGRGGDQMNSLKTWASTSKSNLDAHLLRDILLQVRTAEVS